MQHGLKLRAEVKPSSPLACIYVHAFSVARKTIGKKSGRKSFPEKKTWALNHQGKLSLSDTSLWRNRLARSAVNRKVGGSSPPRDELFFFEREECFLAFFDKIGQTNGAEIVSCQDGRAV